MNSKNPFERITSSLSSEGGNISEKDKKLSIEFRKMLALRLGSLTHNDSEVDEISIKRQSIHSVLEETLSGGCFICLKRKKINLSLIHIDENLQSILLHYLMGGSAHSSIDDSLRKELSKIDEKVILKFTQDLISPYKDDIGTIEIEKGVVTHSLFIKTPSPNKIVTVFLYECVAGGIKGNLSIVLGL